MLRFAVPSLALVLLVSSIAHADAPSPSDDEKSPEVAVLLSLGVTTAGVITTLAADNDTLRLAGIGAMFVGPSTGRWYAGEAGLGMLGLRAAAAGAMVYGFVQVLRSDCDEEDGPCDGGAGDVGAVLMLGGAATWVGATIADVILAERDARRWNERHALSVAPARFAGDATGVVMAGRF